MVTPAAPVVVHHDLGRTAAVVVWVVAFGLVAASWPPGVSGAMGVAGISGVVWALGWRPVVVVADDAVIVRNPLRDVRIGWAALDEAEFDWSLRLRAGVVVVRAAAAPGPASMGALYDRRTARGVLERRTVTDVGRQLPPALLAVRQRWATHAHGASAVVVVTRPWASVVVLGASLVSLAGAVVLI